MPPPHNPMPTLADAYRVAPGSRVRLTAELASDRRAFDGDKAQAQDVLDRLTTRLSELLEILYAEHRHKLLIVLQAMDTGGKDSTIRDVFAGAGPQGVRVVPFKTPTQEELDHDYLWRIHHQVPAKGECVIFNRSHYEDVLIVRVRGLVPTTVWRRRYEHITSFERMLTDEGTTVVKFFLHIDKDEQGRRLAERQQNPRKRWKFDAHDLEERRRWTDYMAAYEEAIARTSTPRAPWYVVPANKKWYRNLMVASALVRSLDGLRMRFPNAPVMK